MPTLHAERGFALEMVMFDCLERPHVHVRGNGGGGAKVWLEPLIGVASTGTYNAHEVGQILKICRARSALLLDRWAEECVRAEAEG